MLDPIPRIDPSTIAAVIEASITAHQLSRACLPGAVLHAGPESIWLDSGIADGTLNAVLYARFRPDMVDAQIESILSHFRRRSRPISWYVGPSTEPDNLGRYLLAHGMMHDDNDDEPGMAIEIEHMREDTARPPGLAIETVRDEAGLVDWISVWLFPVPEDIRRRHLDVLLRLGLGDALPRRYYVGRVDGVPVATAELFMGEGVAAVHLVITLPQVRRQGIGSAMTRHALHAARALGYHVGVLTASPLGRGIYRQIGFREYCWFQLYRWQPNE